MKDNLDGLLWYSIVGMTDQLVHERRSLATYESEYATLRSLVLNAYPLEHEAEYVACTLKIWKSRGKYLLETMFALMGVPLEQAKQKYLSMNSAYKSNLKALLALHAPKFGLDDVYFHSFSKKYECNIELSASDTVYAITALMESDNLETDVTDEEIWEQNFWDAYDSMSSKNVDLLMEGLKQSITLQKEITRQVTSMIEKRVVTVSGPFRYAFLTESAELKYFVHPMALTKLGLFAMDTFVALNKPKKPFLIGALNEKKNNYLIVGITGSHSTDIKDNKFGEHFRKAAEMTSSNLKYQSFDTSVIEISKPDMPKFIEHLHSGLVEAGLGEDDDEEEETTATVAAHEE
eukprot:gene12498-14670_t